MNAKPETVPCTRCAEVEVPVPVSIEEDPLCGECLSALIFEAADRTFTKKSNKPIIKCRSCGEKFEGRLRDRRCPECVANEAKTDEAMGALHDKEMAAGHIELAHDLDPMDWHHNHDPRMMGV